MSFLQNAGAAFPRFNSITLALPGYDKNPVAMIRDTMALCPDEAPAVGTVALAFITPGDLRESIRGDLSTANSNLSVGEWKGSTVLAGAAVEALLLWALQKRQRRDATAILKAISEVVNARVLSSNPGSDLESRDWGLHQYAEVAGHLQLVTDDTLKLVRLTKDFRNLIHPGAAARFKQKCDRSTALTALAAAEGVVRDLEGAAKDPSVGRLLRKRSLARRKGRPA